MTHDEAVALAKSWMTEHGYTQWSDLTWQYQGYEADPVDVLAEYMEEEGGKATGS
jgi:hypothetical protein